MSSAWRHSCRIAGVPAFVGGGPPRTADGALGRGVPRPDGAVDRGVPRPDGAAARRSFRVRVFLAGGSAGFAGFRVAVALLPARVAVRRSGDRPAAGVSAAVATPRVTGRPFDLSVGVPASGSVSAISSCGTGCAGTGQTGVGIGAGGRSAAGAGPSGAGWGRYGGGWGTATQPAVRSTESRRNVVRRGCMGITVPEPAGVVWALGPGPPSRVNRSYAEGPHGELHGDAGGRRPPGVADTAREGLANAVEAAGGAGSRSRALIRAARESFVDGRRQAMGAGGVVMAVLLLCILVRGPHGARPEAVGKDDDSLRGITERSPEGSFPSA